MENHAIWKPSSSHLMKSKSEKLGKHYTPWRSEQSAKEVTQSEKAEVHQEAVGAKRKRMTGHAFTSRFKKKHNNVVDGPPAVDYSDDSRTSTVVREIINNSESVPTNCSAKSKDVIEPETTTCLIRSACDAINLACVAETITPQSAQYKNSSLLGTCILCSKEKRLCYNSQEKELCTCDDTAQKDLDCSSNHKERVDQGASQMDDHGTVCDVCNNDGKLLCCEGKDCKIIYHLSCLDPYLPDDLPGVRHCPKCANKKLKLGIHSVSEGVESIWDVREVDLSKAKGIRQRQYLVKYRGLAHIHNHWVPEKQLLLKNQSLVSNFMAKDETARWSVDWTVPHRLLRKSPILDKIHTSSSADILESYEWLVKWKGLDYDHATWELESSYFLSSSLGRNLMSEYEMRREKAKREVDKSQKGFVVELSELPVPASGVNLKDNFLLKNVYKLRERWCKSQNTVVFDNQDRAMALVFFIRSLAEICHPFLIITASDSLSHWEAEFAQLAPSVDVVVYNGNADIRKRISASEFYEEGGCVMLQVLLSSPEAVFEDIDMLSCIRWQSIVIDEYHQHSQKAIDLEQIKILTTDSKILLLSGQIKDTMSEHLKILSLLDSEHEYNKRRGLRSVKNENLAKLKERLSRFIAYGSVSKMSRFLEYWVPIQILNHQLEQYCATLIFNSILLCSCSRYDKFGALRDILLTVRKCCDHPYLVDPSVQECIIAERRPAAELLTVGIKASGKLQFLEMMLTQVKARGLQVLVLFQSVGSGGFSVSDILDDFLAQKFGQNSYERVDAKCSPTSKLAAVKRFNKKDNGPFVLLLEKSACSSTVKISSLDVIILYNSDWNPENDFRALQKLSIDLSVDQIKVFRLYSSCTVEERALVLAKKHLNLDNKLQVSSSRAPSDSLLMWCASYLLNKLEDYHSERCSELNSKFGPSLLNEIIEEFESILSGCGEMSKRVRVISRVKLDVGSYSADIPLLGESNAQLIDVDEPRIFWKNLLDDTSPQWKHIKWQSPRNRKRVHYLDGSVVKFDTENDGSGKKHRRALLEDVYQAAAPDEVQELQATRVVTEEGASRVVASSPSQSPLRVRDDMSGQSSSQSLEVDKFRDKEINPSSDKQKSLHDSLQEETERLCQILKLSEDVNQTLRRFLEYVISNPPICRDSSAVMQAFQMSLLWVAASISKQETDKTELLNLAKQHLNYQCTEEQVQSIYVQMLDLKQMYLHCSPTTCSSPKENNSENATPNSSSANLKYAKTKTGENLTNEGVSNVINEIQKKCVKRMKKLVQKQNREIEEVYQNWEVKKLKMETDYKLASALVRCIYGEGSARTTKLTLLDNKFTKKMEANNLLKNVRLEDIEAKQLGARKEKREKADRWIAEAKACCSGQPAEDVGGNASVETLNDLIIINQPEFTREIVCVDPPATGEAVLDEMRSVKLDYKFTKEMEVNDLLKEAQLKDVEAKQLGARKEEREKADRWIAEAIACCSVQPAEEVVGGNASVETLNDLIIINQPEFTREIVCVDPPATGEAVLDEMKLDYKFTKEMEVNDLLKEAQLKDVEAKQLGARKEEREKADRWIAEAIACCSVQPAEEVVGGNASVETLNDLIIINQPEFTREIVCVDPPATREAVLDEMGSVELNDKVHMPSEQAEASLQVPEDSLHRNYSSELQDQGVQAVEEHQNNFYIEVAVSETIEGVTTSKSNFKLPDQDAPAPNVEDHGTLQIEDKNLAENGTVTPSKSNIDVQAIHSCEQQLLNVSVDVSLSKNQSTAIEVGSQTHDSPRNLSLTTEAAETEILVEDQNTSESDGVKIPQSYSELPDQDALPPAVEDHGTPQIENSTVNPLLSNFVTQHIVSPSENRSTASEVESQTHDSPRNLSRTTEAAETEILVEDQNTSESDTVKIPQSYSELPDQDALPPAVEDHGTLQIENSTVNPLLSNFDTQHIVSPSENRSTASEVENQSHDSGRNLEIEMLPLESASCAGANLEMQNNTAISPSQAFLQLRTDLGDPITSWDSPTLSGKPLQIELENICRKNKQLEKIHQEMSLQLKSDCEKEMQEMAAQVLKKYELKNQEAEAEYISKKNGLNENRKKVFTNNLLAKAFSFICEDLQPSGLPGIKQDFLSRFMHQQSPQHSVGPPPVANAINNFQAYRPPAHVNNNHSSLQISQALSPQLQAFRPPAHVNNHHSSLQIRQALSSQLQAFRPAAPSFISHQDLQQRMLELAAITNQNWPQHQVRPLSPWPTFPRPVDRQFQVPGEPCFLGFN